MKIQNKKSRENTSVEENKTIVDQYCTSLKRVIKNDSLGFEGIRRGLIPRRIGDTWVLDGAPTRKGKMGKGVIPIGTVITRYDESTWAQMHLQLKRLFDAEKERQQNPGAFNKELLKTEEMFREISEKTDAEEGSVLGNQIIRKQLWTETGKCVAGQIMLLAAGSGSANYIDSAENRLAHIKWLENLNQSEGVKKGRYREIY